jgi:LysR family hydrogen peroxide-inducible transcriptional activator
VNHQQLRYLIAVAREHHFGRAAASCFVSQPTLSLGIKKLEDELGVELFVRNPGDALPTPIGAQVVKQAERILREVDVLKTLAREPAHPLAGALRVGVVDTVAPYVMPYALAHISHFASHLELHVETGLPAALSKKLAGGALDGVIDSGALVLPGSNVRMLYKEPFKVVVPAGHPLSEGRVKREALRQERVLLLEKGHGVTEQVLAFLPELAEVGNGGWCCNQSFEGILQMVIAGLGVTVLPCTVACSPLFSKSRLSSVCFEDTQPFRPINLVCRSDCESGELLEVLGQSILATFDSPPVCSHVVRAEEPGLPFELRQLMGSLPGAKNSALTT